MPGVIAPHVQARDVDLLRQHGALQRLRDLVLAAVQLRVFYRHPDSARGEVKHRRAVLERCAPGGRALDARRRPDDGRLLAQPRHDRHQDAERLRAPRQRVDDGVAILPARRVGQALADILRKLSRDRARHIGRLQYEVRVVSHLSEQQRADRVLHLGDLGALYDAGAHTRKVGVAQRVEPRFGPDGDGPGSLGRRGCKRFDVFERVADAQVEPEPAAHGLLQDPANVGEHAEAIDVDQVLGYARKNRQSAARLVIRDDPRIGVRPQRCGGEARIGRCGGCGCGHTRTRHTLPGKLHHPQFTTARRRARKRLHGAGVGELVR